MDGATVLGTGTLSGSPTATTTLSTNALAVGSHPITAVYNGDNTFAGSTSSVLTQTVNPGAATTIGVETAANGSGAAVEAQNIASGNSITVYSITRDAYGNFVANPSSTWSLTGNTGGVVSSDLAPANGASATFTGHAPGSAAIHVVNGSLNSNSGTLTVVPGAIAKYAVNAPTPQARSTAFSVTVTAQDANNNTVTTDSSTAVTMTGTGGVQFDGNGNGIFGDNTKTLSSGTFTMPQRMVLPKPSPSPPRPPAPRPAPLAAWSSMRPPKTCLTGGPSPLTTRR